MSDDPGSETFDPPITGGVVAGFDGSGQGRCVVEWALAEAAAHGEPLHVVRAWSLTEAADDVGAPFGIVPSLAECAAAVVADAARCVAEARAQTRLPDVPVHVHAVQAPAGIALAEASRLARLVVVGHRGRGRLHLLLGSVTEHLLGNAACPVVVIGLRRDGCA